MFNKHEVPPFLFKVAEHSFRVRFRWCNSARAQGFQNTNMPSIAILTVYKQFFWYLNFANYRTKEPFVSTANKPLVGTLMTIGDVTVSIAIERSFYLLNNRTHCLIFLYNWTQRIDGFSLLLQRYVRKGNDAKNPENFGFCLLPKEPS